MTSYIQAGGHDVISHRKVLPPGECTRSVCPAHVQQRPAVPDPQYIHSCYCYFQAPHVLQSLDGVHATEGSDAVLMCRICGRPTPTFEWSRAGQRVDSGRVVYDQLTGNLRLEVSWLG